MRSRIEWLIMVDENKINRRTFLETAAKTSISAAIIPTALTLFSNEPACAAPEKDDLDKYDFLMPRVKFDYDGRVKWNVFPGADTNLLRELSQVIRCKTKPAGGNGQSPFFGSDDMFNAVVDLNDIEHLRKYPFLFMTCDGRYTLSRKKKQNFKQYLNEGGFILMDDCVYGNADDAFYQSSCSLMREFFGPESVKPIPYSHEVFSNVYDFSNKGLTYVSGQTHPAHGVFIEDRLAVFLSATDLHCAWAGFFPGAHQNAIQMGINIIMYAISH